MFKGRRNSSKSIGELVWNYFFNYANVTYSTILRGGTILMSFGEKEGISRGSHKRMILCRLLKPTSDLMKKKKFRRFILREEKKEHRGG